MRPFLELNTSMEPMICIPAYTYTMENEVTCKSSLSEVKLLQTLLSGHQIASSNADLAGNSRKIVL